MGIDLYCGNSSFSCSYSFWNTIRETIIKATIDYINDKFKKDRELYDNITNEEDANFIGKGSQYYCYKELLTKMIEEISRPIVSTNIFNRITILDKFLNLTKVIPNIDALIYFDIGGLYALCNKGDSQGYYTSGNAKDIIELFNLIEPFVKNYDDVYECIYISEGRLNNKLYDVYNASIIKNKKISIR